MNSFYRRLPPFLARLIAYFTVVPQMVAAAVAADISVDIRTFIDPSRDMTLKQVMALDDARFTPTSRSDINFGYTKDAVWLRIAVASETDRSVRLSLGQNFVDLIDIYAQEQETAGAAGDFSHVATGDHRPVPTDGLSGLDNAVELDLVAHAPALAYVRLAAVDSALATDVHVYPREVAPYRQTASVLLAGIWFGGMGILGVVQLVFFYYDRRLGNVLMAFATFMVIAVYMGSLGVSRMLLFPGGGAGNDIFISVSIWLSLIASTLAAIYILELKESSPWLHRIFRVFIAVGLVGIGCGIAGLHHLFAPFASIASIGLATLAAVQGLRTANAGGTATRLRAAAYVVLVIGVAAVMIQRTAFISLPLWTVHVYAAACILQTILLTAALGVRLRTAEDLNTTMRQQALTAAQAAEEQAMRLVEERTRELFVARQTAEDALQAELASQRRQVQFMEVISHQYRTPLAALLSHVFNIGLSLPASDADNHDRLNRMEKSILRLVEALEVNLSRSRLQGPAFQPVLAPVSADGIAGAAAARAGDLLQSAIVTEIASGDAMRVEADEGMLGVAIINLLENAVKFSRSKGREPVVLSCRPEGDQVVIAVTDKGIGIPAAEIGSAFGASWRGSNAAGVEGSGMGLALVARIVASHGGTVGVESVEGVGTTVTIRLPALER